MNQKMLGAQIERKRSRSKEKTIKKVTFIDLEETCYVLDKGDLIANRYKYLERIADGTFGRVYKVKDMWSNSKRALKMAKDSFNSLKREYEILDSLHSYDKLKEHQGRQYIVSCYGIAFHNNTLCIIQELLGLSLYEYKIKVGQIQLYKVRDIMKQVIFALDYMHFLSYVHTDIKLDNIVFQSPYDTDSVKIIDFGNTVYGRKVYTGIINTKSYRAPEAILGLEWGSKSDIWCLGCVLYEILKSEALFNTTNLSVPQHLALIEKTLGKFPSYMIQGSKYFENGTVKNSTELLKGIQIPDIRTIPQQFQSFLKAMLSINPLERQSAKELLRHSIFIYNFVI